MLEEYRAYLLERLTAYNHDKETIDSFIELCKRYPNNENWDNFLCAIVNQYIGEYFKERRQNEKGA